jgi:HEPN domain-containing protein
MKDRNLELALRWLEKADHDLITARQTLALQDGPTDTPCFHAQQATEKALKAVLTYHQVAFPKIHDLMRLLDMSISLFPSSGVYREPLIELSDYAIEVRYPGDWGDWFDPSRNDATAALSVAEGVVSMVREHITAGAERTQ